MQDARLHFVFGFLTVPRLPDCHIYFALSIFLNYSGIVLESAILLEYISKMLKMSVRYNAVKCYSDSSKIAKMLGAFRYTIDDTNPTCVLTSLVVFDWI